MSFTKWVARIDIEFGEKHATGNFSTKVNWSAALAPGLADKATRKSNALPCPSAAVAGGSAKAGQTSTILPSSQRAVMADRENRTGIAPVRPAMRSGGRKCLVEIGDQVVDVFDAD
ncbi:MAG: hypothetical protein IPH83_11500 [Gammaproteobacteria bacterium]|nr:hypothetical protein [Gammaproteobacteria bacterium]